MFQEIVFTCKQRPWVQASVAGRVAHLHLLEDLVFTNTWSSALHTLEMLTMWVWSGAWTEDFPVLPQESSTELSLTTRTIVQSFLLIQKITTLVPFTEVRHLPLKDKNEGVQHMPIGSLFYIW